MALFELEQHYGEESEEEWVKPTFKDCVAADIDLAFFNGSHIGRNVGHVAIITETDGNGKFKMIHSTIQRGVMIDNFPEGSYYPPRLVGFGRVLPE